LRRSFSATILFAVVAVASTAALSWLSYRTVRLALEGEFARRLEGLAAAGATQVRPADIADASVYGEEGAGYIALQVLLEQLRATPGTWNASLLDSAGAVVYDGRRDGLHGLASPLDTLAPSALALAREGIPAVSRPYRHAGMLMRAGLAPVLDAGRVAGVLAVEADATPPAALDRFRQTTALTALLIVLVIIVLVAVRERLSRRAAELERRLSRAENLAAMGRLTATLAHEIKNPLAIIRGSAQRLGRLDPEAQRMADFVVEESDRLSRTLARYLDFARGGEEVAGASGGGADAAATLRATLDLLQDELAARRVEVEHVGQRLESAPVPLDAESLKQVYLNLILNAMDAMPDGGRLTVALAERRGKIEVVVADTGPGIPAATLAQIGQPFATTKAKGSGLGLFLTRRLVRSAGGELEIRSEVGRGTTCVVRLPRRKA
jgi:signal transduction histidine kinase